MNASQAMEGIARAPRRTLLTGLAGVAGGDLANFSLLRFNRVAGPRMSLRLGGLTSSHGGVIGPGDVVGDGIPDLVVPEKSIGDRWLLRRQDRPFGSTTPHRLSFTGRHVGG